MVTHVDTKAFVVSFKRGLLCLHPTDTLVGLTSNSYDALCAYKQRPPSTGFVHLAADAEVACSFWQPLPTIWQQRLCPVWPASLTVVWHAANNIQQGTQDGMLAIRVPRLPAIHAWFAACLRELRLIPSTSVNQHRQPPLTCAAAVAYLQDDHRVHVPAPLQQDSTSGIDQPSTLIRLHPDGTWTVLRAGAFTCPW